VWPTGILVFIGTVPFFYFILFLEADTPALSIRKLNLVISDGT
jgi:hypothetical protein